MMQTKRITALAIASLFIIGAFATVVVADNNLSVADNSGVDEIPTLNKMDITSDTGITSANQQMVEYNVGTVAKVDNDTVMTVTGDFAIDVKDGEKGITIPNPTKIHINGSHKIIFNFTHESASTGNANGIYGNEKVYVQLDIEGTDKSDVLTLEANCTGGEFNDSNLLNAHTLHVKDCTLILLIKSSDDSKLKNAISGTFNITNSEVIIRDAADGTNSHISDVILDAPSCNIKTNSCLQISSHDHSDGTHPMMIDSNGRIISTDISYKVSNNPDAKYKQMTDIGTTSPTVEVINGYRALIAGVPSLIEDDDSNGANIAAIALVITLIVAFSSIFIVIYGKKYE